MMNDLKIQLLEVAQQQALEELYVLRLYALEKLLQRMTCIYDQYDHIIVRGSLITRYWGQPKYFRKVQDLDFMVDEPFDEVKGKQIIEQMLTVDLEDGLQISTTYVVTKIWEETELPALRFEIPVHVCGEAMQIQIDLSFNDPLIPPAVFQEYQTLLGDKMQIFTITPELACVWKIHGLFEFWDQGFRWQAKTLYDIFVIMDMHELDVALLKPAIKVAFEDRNTPFKVYQRVLNGEFGQSRGARRGWEKLLESHEGRILYEDFKPLLVKIRSVIDGLFIDLMT